MENGKMKKRLDMHTREVIVYVVLTLIAFSIFPVIIVYLLLSKFIVSGVALGGVKG